MSRIDAADALIALGTFMLGAGLAAYDWRLALVVIGGIVMVLGIVGAVRG